MSHPRPVSSTLAMSVTSLLAVATLVACSAAGDDGGGPASAGGGSAGSAGAARAGGPGVTPNGNGAADSGPSLDLNAAGTPERGGAGACERLSIGIFGNPGSNGSSNFQQWLMKAGTSVQRIQTTPDEPVTAATFEPFDVVVLDYLTRDYSADEAASFAAWVSAGGGVAAMSGYRDDAALDWHGNSLLAPLGVAFNGDRVWGPATSFAQHTITQGLTSVTFTGGYPVKDLGTASGTRTPLAFVPTMPPTAIAYAVQMDAGRAFVWGDEWIEFDSEWAALPEIPKLWVQVFSWIAPVTTCALTPPK